MHSLLHGVTFVALPHRPKCYQVRILEDSPLHPYQWSKRSRSLVVVLLAAISVGTQMSTSMFGQAVPIIADQFNVSYTSAMLPTSVYLFGLAFGPMFIGPITEKYGRKYGIAVPYLVGGLVTLLSYFVKSSFAGVLVLRAVSGFLGSAPIISSGAALKDMFEPGHRADILLAYAIVASSGPAIGPLLGGLVVNWTGSYHWIYLITGGYMVTSAMLCLAVIKESFILKLEQVHMRRARQLYPDSWFQCALPAHPLFSIKQLQNYMVKPYQILFTHAALWVSLYGCFAYGLMYMGVACMPYIVSDLYHWTHTQACLFNFCQLVGIIVGSLVNLVVNYRFRAHTVRVRLEVCRWNPELRLVPMIIGSFLLPTSFALLWLTGRRSWIALAISQIIASAGFFTIFQSALNYIIDIHGHNSASAVSATVMLRSLAGGLMPLLATYILHTRGVQSLCTIMIAVSTPLTALPILMFVFWRHIRPRSPYVVSAMQ